MSASIARYHHGGVCDPRRCRQWGRNRVVGVSKAAWLSQWLALPNSIPSTDTFQRVLAQLAGEACQQCFLKWVQGVFVLTEGQVIAIDGKTRRGTYDKPGQPGLHLVRAWAA
ncbi:MAG: ISAs1 family transposase [Chloroflexota bacterium]